jgi:HSP20 family protein
MLLDNWFGFFDVEKTLAEMDRMFDAVGRPLGIRSVPRGTFPAINVYDEGDGAVLTAELPGVAPEDIELTVQNETLTLKARRHEQAGEQSRVYRRERTQGEFLRTVTLPAPVNAETVKAEYKNGLLRVHMEKAPEAKAKKIEIRS